MLFEHEIEARFEHAGATLLALPAPGPRPAGFRCGMPPIVREYAQSYGWEPARMRPPVPSPTDIDAMDEALGSTSGRMFTVDADGPQEVAPWRHFRKYERLRCACGASGRARANSPRAGQGMPVPGLLLLHRSAAAPEPRRAGSAGKCQNSAARR